MLGRGVREGGLWKGVGEGDGEGGPGGRGGGACTHYISMNQPGDTSYSLTMLGWFSFFMTAIS